MSYSFASYTLLFTVLALGCNSGKKALNQVKNLIQEDCVTLVGEHKVPTEATIPQDSVNFFAIKTTEADLFDSQEAIIKALKVEDKGPNHYRTLVPGVYKTTLQKDEYLVVGTYQYYQEAGNYEYHNFMEFMVKLDNGNALESTLSTIFTPAAQSEFASMPNPRLIPNDGVMAKRIDIDNFKYSVNGSEVTLDVPAYIDGRKFQ